jgi:sterol desaturase/sphingolipid hydroxylase (fatty acid hydroxylase superfamily)
MKIPTLLTIVSTAAFLVLERLYPGRRLPYSPGWYVRALAINFVQLAITLATGKLWEELFTGASVLHLAAWRLPLAEGFVGWFVGTFVYYWWHRVRHQDGFWRIFHQVHHSPARIEILTSFYKHPVEILANAILSAAILYPLLGCSLLGAVWYNFFAATGEYFYHANVKTPAWLRYFVQTPELHSIHHQFGVHAFNYGDIPIWDRLFGTYRDATVFSERCGFPDGAEQRLGAMLRFVDALES